MSDRTLSLLRDVIAIDSVNPSLVPGGAGEAQVAARIAEEMRRSGMEVELSDAAPGRPNVVGVLEGRRPGKTLVLCGHTDTVGVAGMKAPFDPVEQDGRMYGRGSQDMKGGLAAIVGSACRLAEEGGLASGRLVVAAVADEEYASIGAEAFVRQWKGDGGVVTEPTDLKIGIGHRGFSWVEVTTEGRAAHGSRPKDGRDAILRMGRVLARLEALDRELQSRAPHPVLTTGSLHASFIEGGREMSTYPDRAVLQLERRTLAGEPERIALREIEAILKGLSDEDEEFRGQARLTFDRPPYETPSDCEIPRFIEAALSGLGRTTSREGMSFWTDAAILGQAGIPSVVFGPGGEGLHSLEEWVRVDEVLACRDVLCELARSFFA
jgi:acetylornithine deacetylase